MKKQGLFLIYLLFFSLSFVGCGNSEADIPVTIHVSAAASLTDALTEILAEYSKESNALIQLNFGGSGTLRKQIEEGAPCDLFISASKDHMDTLEEAGLIEADSRKNLLKNKLTLIASKEKSNIITLENLTSDDVKTISVGTPDSVPAGKYAQQALEHIGIWEEIQPKLVFAKDVRQVLQYVDTGNADCGIVYESDTILLETGVVIADMPEESYEPVIYPVTITTNSEQNEAAKLFYEFLNTYKAKNIFEKYGFTVYQ